jgi:CAAX protease family protein
VKLPWAILVLALLLPTVGALVYFVAARPTDPLFRITYTTSKFIQFTLPVVALLALDRRRLAEARILTRGISVGLLVGMGIALAILGLYSVGLRNSPQFAGLRDQVHAKVTGFGLASPAGFVAIAVFLSAIHSFLEEYYWRWFVHAGLRQRLSQPIAMAISSLAFVAHHVVVLAVYFPDRFWTATAPFALAVAVGGAIWAWLYDRYQSLAGPWVAHLLTDAAIMAVGYDLLYR